MDFMVKNNFTGFTILKVFFLLRKCVSITNREKTDPMAVARPAPIIPILNTKTKK